MDFVEDGYIWFDYFSVPQRRWLYEGDYEEGTNSMNVSESSEVVEHLLEEALADAVASIPAYVEQSKYFFVLCPPAEHADLREESGALERLCEGAGWGVEERLVRRSTQAVQSSHLSVVAFLF